MKTLMISAAATALMTTAAFAGGLNDPAPQPAPMAPAPVMAPMTPSVDWTGGYVGGSFGTVTVQPDGFDDIDGNAFGLFGGYNYDLGSVVLGGELDYSRATLDVEGDPEADILRLKGRVGYDAGNFMPYFTAGYAELSSDDAEVLDGESGYLYGLGADYRVTDSVTVGAELLQHDFEDIDTEAQTLSLRAAYNF